LHPAWVLTNGISAGSTSVPGVKTVMMQRNRAD
jgi:hypothetical protein